MSADTGEFRRNAASGIVETQLVLGQLALDSGDHEKAIEWFRIAARSGEARAHNMLGRCFERGWGTAADAERAAAHFSHAAEQGDAWAMFNLADLLLLGRGVARDEAEALALYMRAASLGHVKSMNMIGLFYEDGRVIAADRKSAWNFFLAGAEGNDCWAQYNCARLSIEDGKIDTALDWLEKTLRSGFPDFWRAVQPSLSNHRIAEVRAFAARLPDSGEATA